MSEEEQEIDEEEEQEGRRGISIFRIAGLLILIGAFVGGAFAVSHYGNLVSDLDENIRMNSRPATEIETEISVSPSEGKDDEESLIMEAVVASIELDESEAEITISDNTGTHAKGNIVETGSEVGGGYFIAALTDDGWVLVYSGQANPTCEEIEPYDFPAEMVEECLDDEGEVVTRE